VRLLSHTNAESHILDALHGVEVRAEDDSEAESVTGVALQVAREQQDNISASRPAAC
jgi:hypothetical protein